ncbi:MAG: hypothetical protein JRJ26_00185 [Deltaproteobacteria bacterium]|nr:hypothetical protein [Deltaproteobacteria bacterium]
MGLRSHGRIKGLLFALAVVVWFVPVHVRALEAGAAFVREGAFLLSEKPRVWKNGRLVHDLVGYLPIGTVVYFDPNTEMRELFNYALDGYEQYLFVRTDMGLAGLLRNDLKVDLGEKEVLIPVGNRRIPIRTQASTKYQARTLSEFSRSDGVYLTVVDDRDPEFYDVELQWTATTKRPPDRGRLRKRWVADGEVLILSPEALPSEHPRVSGGDTVQDEGYLSRIAERIREIVGMDVAVITSFLTDLETLRCRVGAEADIDLGVKIFGTGLGLEFALTLKEKNRFYDLGETIYYRGERPYLRFITVKDILCKNNRPYRLANFAIQEADLDPAKRTIVSLDDLPQNIRGEWKSSFQARDAPRRMIRIDGYDSYRRAFSFLERESAQGGGYLSRLNAYDRRIVINIILSQIAYFTKPEITR